MLLRRESFCYDVIPSAGDQTRHLRLMLGMRPDTPSHASQVAYLSSTAPAGKGDPQNFVADFAVFDPATGQSRALAPLQTARGNGQMVATADGRLMVLGGRTFVNNEAIVRGINCCCLTVLLYAAS